MYQPLADRIRPKTLDEVVGQRHILGENGLLRRVIESGKIPNMVFYGPSGTGKTTVANIIADRSGRTLRRLNATTAALSDIRDVMDEVGTLLAPNGVLLYLDEIQYFNKKQQQSLLEFIENGKITLIASTTENPYFTIFNAILSRSTVFEFKALTAEDILPAVERGFRRQRHRCAQRAHHHWGAGTGQRGGEPVEQQNKQKYNAQQEQVFHPLPSTEPFRHPLQMEYLLNQVKKPVARHHYH